MPTYPYTGNLTGTSADILNAIRNHATASYQERVPIATQDTIRETGNAILSSEATQNEFLNALVNRIALVLITSKSYTNPLREFKKGILEYGESIEEIFVNIAKAHKFDPAVAEKEVFKREIPDVNAAFHRLNSKQFYKVTVEQEQLATAFISANGLLDLVGKIVDSLYSGAELDEFLTMKQLIAESANNGMFYPVGAGEPTADNAKAIVTAIKQYSNKLEFMTGKYNPMGVQTHTKKANQVLFIDAALDALIDVEVLAAAFNMSKAEFMGRRVLVDEFTNLTGVYAALVDENYFMVFDKMIKTTEQYNAEGLYWNYFYHVWKIYSTSPFANAILFTSLTPKVTINAINGDKTATVGQEKTYSAVVSSTGYAPTAVTMYWIDLTEAPAVKVPFDGKITFPHAGNFVIGAKAVYDNTDKNITVNVSDA